MKSKCALKCLSHNSEVQVSILYSFVNYNIKVNVDLLLSLKASNNMYNVCMRVFFYILTFCRAVNIFKSRNVLLVYELYTRQSINSEKVRCYDVTDLKDDDANVSLNTIHLDLRRRFFLSKHHKPSR